MFTKKAPKISVCIPVFGTEKSLASCLESVASQNFDGTEIIVVDDGSFVKSAKFENNKIKMSAQKIVKDFKKNHKNQHLNIKFIQHEKNKGLVEARRSAVYEAEGKYIVFVDSDDTLPGNALKNLFATAEKSGADIVHGKANVCIEDFEHYEMSEQKENLLLKMKKRFDDMNKKSNCVFFGELLGRQIFDGFLWGKIFTREICLEAFDKIPQTFCIFGEDFLTYFFISLFAKKYFGIDENVYNYFVNTGISSNKKIDSIEEWQKVCSTASVFTILLSWIEENLLVAENSRLTEDARSTEKITVLTEEEKAAVKNMCRYYAKNNLAQLQESVVPHLHEEARTMLCEWWGEKMINSVENFV